VRCVVSDCGNREASRSRLSRKLGLTMRPPRRLKRASEGTASFAAVLVGCKYCTDIGCSDLTGCGAPSSTRRLQRCRETVVRFATPRSMAHESGLIPVFSNESVGVLDGVGEALAAELESLEELAESAELTPLSAFC
jgi:hypothetical protein